MGDDLQIERLSTTRTSSIAISKTRSSLIVRAREDARALATREETKSSHPSTADGWLMTGLKAWEGNRNYAAECFLNGLTLDVRHVELQFWLGNAYSNGLSGNQNEDDTNAVFWWKKAADQEHPIAQYNLACAHASGYGAKYDLAQAALYLHKAAMKGSAPAQYRLGQAYRFGEGVPEDLQLAAEYYRRAAAQGYKPAQHDLASLEQGLTRN